MKLSKLHTVLKKLVNDQILYLKMAIIMNDLQKSFFNFISRRLRELAQNQKI